MKSKFLFLMAFVTQFSFGADAQFSAQITVSGDEVKSYESRTYSYGYYYEVIGGYLSGRPTRSEELQFCAPLKSVEDGCKLDTSRQGGSGAPGYGIYVTSFNSPGGSRSENYSFSSNNGLECISGKVSFTALRRQRGWYQAKHEIYMKCPIRTPWTASQIVGPFTLSDKAGYKYMTSYNGPLGSPSATDVVAKNYSVSLLNKTPANAVITTSMLAATPSDAHHVGPNFYALYSANDINARALEVTQGMQNIYNEMPLVAGRRTVARLYAISTYAESGITAELRAYDKNWKELSGSPLMAEKPVVVNSTGLDRTRLDQSFVFMLPPAWTYGDINFKATVNSSRINSESDTSNNARNFFASFKSGKRDSHLENQVVHVPISLRRNNERNADRVIFDRHNPYFRPIVSHALRMMPSYKQDTINCNVKPLRDPVNRWNTEKNVGWYWMINALRSASGKSLCHMNDFWHGMVSRESISPGGEGAVSGLAWGKTFLTLMGASTGTDTYYDGETFVHELGHAKSLDHVCKVHNAKQIDDDFPYNDTCELTRGNKSFFTTGNDGYMGLDVYHDYFGTSRMKVITSQQVLPMPDDGFVGSPIMAYTMGKHWISPYDYCKLLDKSGIDCKKSSIAKHMTKEEAAQFAAQEKAAQHEDENQDRFKVRAYGAGFDNYVPVYPVETSVLPSGYKPPLLTNKQATYLEVSGAFDLSLPTAAAFQVSSYANPSDYNFDESNAFNQAVINRADTSYKNTLVLRQYLSSSNKSILKADVVAQVDASDTDPSDRSRVTMFNQLVIPAAGARYFELIYGSHIIASYSASNNAPVVNFNPINFTQLTEESKISWTASDADQNTLTYDLYYRPNPASPWRLVDMGIDTNVYSMGDNLVPGESKPLKYFAASNLGQFRVDAFDGFNTSTSYSSTFSVPNNAPVVEILQRDGLKIDVGETLYLDGRANDTEDDVIPSLASAQAARDAGVVNNSQQFEWYSDRQGFLGYGPSISTRSLSKGAHWISLRVRDSGGMSGQAQIQVFIGVDNNIAPQATTSASSTYCPNSALAEHCYYTSRVNDGNTSTILGGTASWSNIDSILPQWLQLEWTKDAVITGVEVITTESYPIKSYRIEYWNGSTWIAVGGVDDNVNKSNEIQIPSIKTRKLRLLGLSGPDKQVKIVRVNELIVRGYLINPIAY